MKCNPAGSPKRDFLDALVLNPRQQELRGAKKRLKFLFDKGPAGLYRSKKGFASHTHSAFYSGLLHATDPKLTSSVGNIFALHNVQF
jgi:hypothetical protein